MIYQIVITPKKEFPERHGEHVRQDIKDLGIAPAPAVRYSLVYRLSGELTIDEVNAIASRLLIDPITETYSLEDPQGCVADVKTRGTGTRNVHRIEVWLKPGVTDTVAGSVVKAVRDLGIGKEITVKTGHQFVFEGSTVATVRQIAERLLVNPMVQEYTLQ